MKAVVAAFNQEKALVGAFSVIVQPVVEPMDRFTALYRKETRRLPAWAAVAVLLYLLSVLGLVILMDDRLPAALTTADIPDNPDTFIEERARRTLRALTSIGARPAGSYENEVLAVDLLRRELQSIKERSHPSHKLTVDIQVNWGFAQSLLTAPLLTVL